MTENRYNPMLHTVAWLTACVTFPMIFLGGLVTSHQAGLSVPDWPTSFGYNMFALPWEYWIGGVRYEHSHRLLGIVVGCSAILLTAVAWITDRRWNLRWLAVLILFAISFQGIVGGLRVRWLILNLAIVHGCIAQAIFCLTALMCVMSSKWWNQNRPQVTEMSPNGASLIRLAILATLCVFAQLIVGAMMRHNEAGLAIPDLPLAYGKIVPPTDETSLLKANSYRAWVLGMTPVTLGQIWLHFGHRIGAIVVSVVTIWLSAKILRRESESKLRVPAILLIVLLLAQLMLGVLTVLLKKPADIASAHVACGALVLVTCFVISIRSIRLYRPIAQPRGFEISYGAKPAIA